MSNRIQQCYLPLKDICGTAPLLNEHKEWAVKPKMHLKEVLSVCLCGDGVLKVMWLYWCITVNNAVW